RRVISLATLGKGVPDLEGDLTNRIQQAWETGASDHCQLLDGRGACEACPAPLSPLEQRKIHIRREGGQTTIARVTCPTAPTFWRWRDIPFPKVAQRELELSEDAEPPGEGKW